MEDQLELSDEPERTDVVTRAPTKRGAAPAAESLDLSARIIAEVAKLPADRVTCRRISGNSYRCNWWAPQNAAGYDNPSMEGLTVTTHRVRQSQFLRVSETYKGLVMVVMERTHPRDRFG